MTDTALALRPDALTANVGALPDGPTYETKPVEVRTELRTSAARFKQAVQAALAALDAEWDPGIAEANRLHKDRIAEKKTLAEPLLHMKTRVDMLLVDYHDADTRIAFAEGERYAVEEAAAQEAQDIAIAAGDVEAALAVPPVSAPPPSMPRTQGLSMRETWRAECRDLLLLVRHVAAHPEYVHLVSANQSALDKMAGSLKGAMRVPGVVVGMKKTPVTGRK